MLARAQSSSHLTHRTLVLLVLLPPHWPPLLSPLPGPWDLVLANNSRPWHHSAYMPAKQRPTPALSTPLPLGISMWHFNPHKSKVDSWFFPNPLHTVILITFGGDSTVWLLRPNPRWRGRGDHPRLLLPSHTPHLIHQQALPNTIQIEPILLPPTPSPSCHLASPRFGSNLLTGLPASPLETFRGQIRVLRSSAHFTESKSQCPMKPCMFSLLFPLLPHLLTCLSSSYSSAPTLQRPFLRAFAPLFPFLESSSLQYTHD